MPRKSHRWRIDWSQESTKRGLARLVAGVSGLIGLRYGAEASAAALSVGLGVVGILGVARSDQ